MKKHIRVLGIAPYEGMKIQMLNYKRELSEEEIKRQMEALVKKELITEEQAESVEPLKILNFFNSNIGKRMAKAERAYREVPFHIEIKSIEFDKNLSKDRYEDERIMLQGIIDCYFEEDGEVILIDYKSDYFKKGEEKAIIEKYKIQIELYARAIQEITNKKVKEKYLYLFYGDKEVEIS